MSKIAEDKALEAYPTLLDNEPFISKGFIDEKRREGYIVGYDQAMQDFLEKAEEFFYDRFNIHPHDCHVIQCVSDTPLETIDDFVKQIKNYMENESEN